MEHNPLPLLFFLAMIAWACHDTHQAIKKAKAESEEERDITEQIFD